jgi:hypothetical protein
MAHLGIFYIARDAHDEKQKKVYFKGHKPGSSLFTGWCVNSFPESPVKFNFAVYNNADIILLLCSIFTILENSNIKFSLIHNPLFF